MAVGVGLGQPRPLVVVGVTIDGGAVIMLEEDGLEVETSEDDNKLELVLTLDTVEEDAIEDEDITAGIRIAAITFAFATNPLVASFK